MLLLVFMFSFISLVFFIARLCVISHASFSKYCSCLEITNGVLLLPTWEQELLGRAPSPGLIHPVTLSWHLSLSYFPPPLSMKQRLCYSQVSSLDFPFDSYIFLRYLINPIAFVGSLSFVPYSYSTWLTVSRDYGLDKKYSIFKSTGYIILILNSFLSLLVFGTGVGLASVEKRNVVGTHFIIVAVQLLSCT